ncbi:serine/threonine protein kinase [Rhodopirellula sp. MGV]|uniref:serine/threonine protein kinase n=1 Tax=Rhodopirellula sp. MGV TaxID=2023130 RepID=UPI0013042E8A|nr:protein kinase [Rhodopirellula sp. MGV]
MSTLRITVASRQPNRGMVDEPSLEVHFRNFDSSAEKPMPTRQPHRDLQHSDLPSQLGIWRLGPVIHDGIDNVVCHAQPIDAAGSPRWDYAIKVAKTQQAQDGIHRSIAAASEVSHPNLITILDGDPIGETPYVVMPRIVGESMEANLKRGSGRPLPVALWFVRQLCQALDKMHQTGWVHGDVKPANLIISANGHVTLVDLGYAFEGTLDQASPFRGTPAYAAPELLSNPSAATSASDLYAAGRILWDWLANVETTNELLLSPVCELVEQMADESPRLRPQASKVVQTLLRLEIDSLGDHIEPSQSNQRRAA